MQDIQRPVSQSKVSYHVEMCRQLNELLSPPCLQSLAAGCFPIPPPRHSALFSFLQCEIEMSLVIEHSVPSSLQTSKRNPSSWVVYFDRHSDPRPRSLLLQLEGAFQIVVHSLMIEEVGVVVLNQDFA